MELYAEFLCPKADAVREVWVSKPKPVGTLATKKVVDTREQTCYTQVHKGEVP